MSGGNEGRRRRIRAQGEGYGLAKGDKDGGLKDGSVRPGIRKNTPVTGNAILPSFSSLKSRNRGNATYGWLGRANERVIDQGASSTVVIVTAAVKGLSLAIFQLTS